jgi:hypothetical protein
MASGLLSRRLGINPEAIFLARYFSGNLRLNKAVIISNTSVQRV